PWNPPRQRSTAWPGRVSPPDHKPVGPVAPRPTIRLAMEQSTIQADPRRAWLALGTAIGLAVIAAWLVLGGGIDRFRPREGLPASPGDVGQPAPDFALERRSEERRVGKECRSRWPRGQWSTEGSRDVRPPHTTPRTTHAGC